MNKNFLWFILKYSWTNLISKNIHKLFSINNTPEWLQFLNKNNDSKWKLTHHDWVIILLRASKCVNDTINICSGICDLNSYTLIGMLSSVCNFLKTGDQMCTNQNRFSLCSKVTVNLSVYRKLTFLPTHGYKT